MGEIGSVFSLTGVELLPTIANNYNYRVLLSCSFIVENNIISQSSPLT